MKISIIIPARNEAASLVSLLPAISNDYPDAEIIVVNDGSDDNTVDTCKENDVKVINHPYQKGNGAAIKSGVRAAMGGILVLMDADGQHSPKDIGILLEELSKGYDMVVGARAFKSHATLPRGIANRFYNWFASWPTVVLPQCVNSSRNVPQQPRPIHRSKHTDDERPVVDAQLLARCFP